MPVTGAKTRAPQHVCQTPLPLASFRFYPAGWNGCMHALCLPQPISLGDGRVTANGIVLVGHPHDQNYVEGGRRVAEELGHNRLHT
jgi:hypothetical protein